MSSSNPSLSLLVQLERTVAEAIVLNRENGLSEMQTEVERNKGERQSQLTEEEGVIWAGNIVFEHVPGSFCPCSREKGELKPHKLRENHNAHFSHTLWHPTFCVVPFTFFLVFTSHRHNESSSTGSTSHPCHSCCGSTPESSPPLAIAMSDSSKHPVQSFVFV